MKSLSELRAMSLDELAAEVLSVRKKQFNQRLKKANQTLDKTHVIAQARKAVAQLKTIMTEKKVGKSHGE